MPVLIVIVLVVIAGLLIAFWPWFLGLAVLWVICRRLRRWWAEYQEAEALRLHLLRVSARERALHHERLQRIAAIEADSLLRIRYTTRQPSATRGTGIEVGRRS